MKLILALAVLISTPCRAAAPEDLLSQVHESYASFSSASLGDDRIWRDTGNRIWFKTSDLSESDVLWINMSSIRSVGNLIAFTVFGDHRRNPSVSYEFSLQRRLVDCSKFVTKVHRQQNFDSLGRSGEVSTGVHWSRIRVGSPEEVWASIVCD